MTEVTGPGYRLILGDCLDVLPRLGRVDAIICDPPYGINIINGGGRGINGWRDYGVGGWDKLRPGKEIFSTMLGMSKTVVVWGGNYFTDYLPPSSQWLIWDKGQRSFSMADCEMAWSSLPKAARVFTYPRAAAIHESGLHPTQKPVEVMRWCIRLATNPGDTILDPFAGSGTTGVAALLEGRRFIGVELDPTYHAIAARRLADAAAQPMLIPSVESEPVPVQAGLHLGVN